MADERSLEVTIGIRDPELARRVVPLGLDAPSANELVRLDLEQIGEIRTESDLEVESDRTQAVIVDVEVLVNPFSDRATERQPDDAGRNFSVFRREGSIHQVDTRGVVAHGAARQPRPWFAVREKRVVAHETGI